MGLRVETPIKCGAEGGTPMDVIVGQSVGQSAEIPVMCGAEGGDPNGGGCRVKCGAEGGEPKVWGREWRPQLEVVVGQSVGQRAETPIKWGAEGGGRPQ